MDEEKKSLIQRADILLEEMTEYLKLYKQSLNQDKLSKQMLDKHNEELQKVMEQIENLEKK